MAVNVSLPKGTRDFSPLEMARRKYIFNTIENVFRLYGFLPIETPAMENLNTLTGKYGEEGDRLIFKILNSGNFLEGITLSETVQDSPSRLAARMCEKALRYDLTVPFARYVVMNRNEITFPFKRYQIQPVWRADRPQKGRYREFYQCDADVIGSNSLLNEVELIQIIDEVFQQLNISVIIKLNNRKILSSIAEIIGAPEKITDITVAIDKLDKIGMDAVKAELRAKNLSDEAIDKIQPVLNLLGNNEEKLQQLSSIIANTETGSKGIEEIKQILNYIKTAGTKTEIQLDLTLARGLDYYTGAIIEVKAKDVEMGSICGGGRYDDLTGIFGMPDVSGVGISFGADRIYDVMLESELFPENTGVSVQLMFINFGSDEEKYALNALNTIRKSGISSMLFPDAVKLKKQMAYAHNLGVPWVAMAGSEEIKQGSFTLKNMNSGEQQLVKTENIVQALKK